LLEFSSTTDLRTSAMGFPECFSHFMVCGLRTEMTQTCLPGLQLLIQEVTGLKEALWQICQSCTEVLDAFGHLLWHNICMG